MQSNLKHRASAGLLAVAAAAALAGCAGEDKPEVASLASAAPSASAGGSKSSERPRHRVDETAADSARLIAPWTKCMKENGADPDTQPNNIEGAERWGKEHQRAGDTCRPLLPLLPWGMDKANPEYRDNIHAWVKCMNDKGLNIIETPDNEESPWRYGGEAKGVSATEQGKIEQDCEKATIGKSDK